MICVSRKFLKIYRAISVKANFYMQFLVVEGFVGYGFRIHSRSACLSPYRLPAALPFGHSSH